jgi:hypothetical protein
MTHRGTIIVIAIQVHHKLDNIVSYIECVVYSTHIGSYVMTD